MTTSLFENTETAFEYQSTPGLKKAKFLFQLFGNNTLVSLGTSATNIALSLHLPISSLFKITVFNHFCGGENFAECTKTIQFLSKFNVGSMLNYGVELKETEEDFEKTILQTLESIAFAGKNTQVKSICIKLTGFGRFDLFEKMDRKEILSKNEEIELQSIKKRLDRLCVAAKENDVVLYVDAEESWIQDALDGLVEEMMEKYNLQKPVIFNTIQLYRNDRLAFLERSIHIAKSKGYFYGVKIVRGAYMEKERERANAMGYPSPIHVDKPSTDKDFNAGMQLCFNHLDIVTVCVASQSEESNLLAISLIDEMNIARNHPNILFAQLLGMGDNITFNMAKAGFNVCKYLPYGPVKEVIPYLIRRAQENTSVQGQMGRELKLILTELARRKKAGC